MKALAIFKFTRHPKMALHMDAMFSKIDKYNALCGEIPEREERMKKKPRCDKIVDSFVIGPKDVLLGALQFSDTSEIISDLSSDAAAVLARLRARMTAWRVASSSLWEALTCNRSSSAALRR